MIGVYIDQDELRRVTVALSTLPHKVQNRVVKAATGKAMRPVMKTAKSSVAVDTGTLKKNITVRTWAKNKKWLSGAIVGARNKGVMVNVRGKTKYYNPAKYLHLVEKGTKYAQAKPFLGPSLLRHASGIVSYMTNAILSGVEREAVKLGKR